MAYSCRLPSGRVVPVPCDVNDTVDKATHHIASHLRVPPDTLYISRSSAPLARHQLLGDVADYSDTLTANFRLRGGGPLTRICNLVVITIALVLLIVALVTPAWFAIDRPQCQDTSIKCFLTAPCALGWGHDSFSCNVGDSYTPASVTGAANAVVKNQFKGNGGLKKVAEGCNANRAADKKIDENLVGTVSVVFLVTAWGAVILLLGTGVITCLTICLNKAPLRYIGTGTSCLAVVCGFVSILIVWLVAYFVPLGNGTICTFEPATAENGGCAMCTPLLAPSLYSCACGMFLIPICVGQMWQTKNPPPPSVTAAPSVVNNTTIIHNHTPGEEGVAGAATTPAKQAPRPVFRPIAKTLPTDGAEPAGEELKETAKDAAGADGAAKPNEAKKDGEEKKDGDAAKPADTVAAAAAPAAAVAPAAAAAAAKAPGGMADDDDDDDDEVLSKPAPAAAPASAPAPAPAPAPAVVAAADDDDDDDDEDLVKK